MRGTLGLQSSRDHFEHSIRIADYVIVPKSKDTVIALIEPPVTSLIALAVCVLPTIHFNNQATFAAHEIDHVRSNWRLSYELEPAESSISQSKPQLCLCVGRLPPQTPDDPDSLTIRSAHGDGPLTRPSLREGHPLPAGGERA